MLQYVPFLRIGQGAGFGKTRDACAEARHRSFNYVWVDTCCTDKTGSAELSEVIDSIFRWNENSELWTVNFDDVPRALEILESPRIRIKSLAYLRMVLARTDGPKVTDILYFRLVRNIDTLRVRLDCQRYRTKVP